jgi:membrane protease YdiL (CAAX protease family)
MALIWTVWLVRSRPSQILPPQRRRAVPWHGIQLLALVFLVLFIIPSVVDAVLRYTPFLTLLYGNDFLAALNRKDTAAASRYAIWSAVLAFPLQLASVAALLKVSGGRAYQVGLTGRRWFRDVLLGVMAFFALMPFVNMFHIAVAWAWREYVAPPVPHPLEQISQTQPHMIDWVLILTSAVVAAAIVEELLFRGVLQPWFTSRPYGGDVAVVASLAYVALVVTGRTWTDPRPLSAPGRSLLIESAPLLFALAMVPVYLLLRLARSPTANGIFGTALLFGIVHASAWPTPIPLFLFGLGLGLLYYRTQSLVPPMVTHALFNLVSAAMLAYQATHPSSHGPGVPGK